MKSNNNIPIHTKGKPSFDNLEKWEREALINPLLDVIKDFYQDPKNRQAYQEWQLKRQAEALAIN